MRSGASTFAAAFARARENEYEQTVGPTILQREAKVVAALREAVSLASAEQRATAYSPGQAEELARIDAAARSRARIARSSTDPGDDATAVSLLREAVTLRLRAIEVAGRPVSGIDAIAGLSKNERSLCKGALDAVDPVSFEGLSRADLGDMRRALQHAERCIAPMVETRSVSVIRATRLGRQAALALAVAYVIFRAVTFAFGPSNVALHKAATASALAPGSAPIGDLVDGNDEGRLPVVTPHGDGAWLAVDLGAAYTVTSVRLYNRQDHSYDDALPFWVEGSVDGQHWIAFTRRRDHFKDWRFDLHPPADWIRWVRVRCVSACSVGLNELEVDGRLAR
jgi:hypothetical protein